MFERKVSMKKILLDTNVVLDFVLKREPFYENAQTILNEITEGNIQGYITASMVTDIFYLLQKTNGKIFACDTLTDLLIILDVLTVYGEDVYSVLRSGWDDFEDALQAQVAVRSDIDVIITRNIKDYKNAQDIKVILLVDFIQYFNKQ